MRECDDIYATPYLDPDKFHDFHLKDGYLYWGRTRKNVFSSRKLLS